MEKIKKTPSCGLDGARALQTGNVAWERSRNAGGWPGNRGEWAAPPELRVFRGWDQPGVSHIILLHCNSSLWVFSPPLHSDKTMEKPHISADTCFPGGGTPTSIVSGTVGQCLQFPLLGAFGVFIPGLDAK